MLRPVLFAFILIFFQTIVDDGQIRVVVSAGEHRPHQFMTAVIKNRSTLPITVCLGPDEMHRENRQLQPWPFSIERFQSGAWTGVPARRGTSGHTEVIKPGVNFGFSFSVDEAGQYRLTLQYWPGENRNASCADFAAGSQVRSKMFQVSD